MRAPRTALVVAIVALSACSIPDKHALGGDAQVQQDGSKTDGTAASPDAEGAPFACLGQPLPTTAPANITVSGESYSISATGNQPLAGVMLSGYVVTDPSPIITVTTDAQAMFDVAVPSGGVPVNGYIVANLSSYMTATLYPSRPFDADAIVGVDMITAGTMMLAAEGASVTLMSNTALVAVAVVDCNNNPITGATVQITNDVTNAPTGIVRYMIDGFPNSTATETDSTGIAFVFNTIGGSMTIHATVTGDVLRAHSFMASTSSTAWTQVAIQP